MALAAISIALRADAENLQNFSLEATIFAAKYN